MARGACNTAILDRETPAVIKAIRSEPNVIDALKPHEHYRVPGSMAYAAELAGFLGIHVPERTNAVWREFAVPNAGDVFAAGAVTTFALNAGLVTFQLQGRADARASCMTAEAIARFMPGYWPACGLAQV